MRIKKSLQNSNTTTYSFGNYYEIHRSPGAQEKHTLYVIGVEGDMRGSFRSNKIWNGFNNYKMYDKLFVKFDEWYGRNVRRDTFENTANYQQYLLVFAYSMSKDCRNRFGASGCALIAQLNGLKMQSSKEK